ncbi:hypothetical protein SAMN05421541_1472 [Actinoplanes philippinensis]|uniref:Uncharacterized protein n=1 Tax=Actinoplanes philippinensis TaxID=35752 RepID=A0A1I2NDV3_9ACTN|nr:hypothetical protein [Actinoplanes philippinensis]SFG02034.1 hypothetical protein SAMN05421541_1472 [Actinoplanes philippinensis]
MTRMLRLVGFVVAGVLAASLVSAPAALAAGEDSKDRAAASSSSGINPKKFKKKFKVRIRPYPR